MWLPHSSVGVEVGWAVELLVPVGPSAVYYIYIYIYIDRYTKSNQDL